MTDHLTTFGPHVDVQAGEERRVQDRAYDLAADGVHRLWVAEQLQRLVEHLTAGFQMPFGLLQLTADVALLGADSLDLLPELVLGPVFFGRQIEEVALFLVELCQLTAELVAYLCAEVTAGVGGGINFCPYRSPELFG